MLCENCKKNTATTYFKQTVNGKTREVFLCSECAAKMGLGDSFLNFGNFGLGLGAMSELFGNTAAPVRSACPSCGMTYEDFVEGSRFGCADCYSVFGPLLGENIRHLQGSEKHVGKRPGHVLRAQMEAEVREKSGEEETGESGELIRSLTKEEQMRLLQTRLKDAPRREDYEEAAALRDEIRSLKEETV